ncbi:hypothetical protein [Bradyrhizobium sp. ORS 111]|uniref:hypothetical protein n=1 Tax=Bradyrhizobium sp. ORS 111 TaxID=1685958 RepID=UPI00388D7992
MLTPSTSPLIKVAARHLLRGDVTGSGETVLSVSVGARTPRGKVEVALQKGDRKRAALWGASTTIGVRRAPVQSLVSPDDRLPTFAEVTSFDPVSAWARLSPAQQTLIGELAVRLAVVANRLNYQHDDFATNERLEIERLESDVLTSFYDSTEPLWADLYGWRSN